MKSIFVDSKNTLPNESEIFNILLKNIEEENIKNTELSIKVFKRLRYFERKTGRNNAITSDS